MRALRVCLSFFHADAVNASHFFNVCRSLRCASFGCAAPGGWFKTVICHSLSHCALEAINPDAVNSAV
jgi:hypothetical protein